MEYMQIQMDIEIYKDKDIDKYIGCMDGYKRKEIL